MRRGRDADASSGNSGNALAYVVFAIPAWQPEPALMELVQALVGRGARRIVVVDDGSGAACFPVFHQLMRLPEVAICRHTHNRGKGRALKTAFAYALAAYPGLRTVVTADADGQHLAADILAVARRAVQGTDAVLGVRDFQGKDVPWRSRFGNLATRWLFRLLAGKRVSDTQTGLRGLPATVLPELLRVRGERYEYETAMLAWLCRQPGDVVELPIATVYLAANRSSHFHPLRDSLRIYATLLHMWVQRIQQAKRPGKQPAHESVEVQPAL